MYKGYIVKKDPEVEPTVIQYNGYLEPLFLSFMRSFTGQEGVCKVVVKINEVTLETHTLLGNGQWEYHDCTTGEVTIGEA